MRSPYTSTRNLTCTEVIPGSIRFFGYACPIFSPLSNMSGGMSITARPTETLSLRRRIKKRLWQRKSLCLLVLLTVVAYSLLSILRHEHFISSGFDLGIFDQVVWQYSRFRAPLCSIRSNLLTENILGDHFSPILAFLVPIYWLTDRVEALLALQALLFAIAAVPIFLFSEKRLGKFPAYLFASSYLIFWGIQKAAEWDFHEVAVAVPTIAFAIYFIDQRRWRAYFICMAVLLLTKEDLALTVIFFGFYLISQKQMKKGLASIAAGALWFFAALKIFIPYFYEPKAFLAEHSYRHWSYDQFGSAPLRAMWTMVSRPWLVIRTLLTPGTKLQTYWYMFHPFLFLPFLSPVFILAVPVILARFLSNNPNFWGTNYHYTATLAPVIVMAGVDSLHRITQRISNARQQLVMIAAILVLLLNLLLLPKFPLWNLASANYWRLNSSDKIGREAVALIPRTASVGANGRITPHLTHRREVYMLSPLVPIPDAEYLIASDKIDPFPFPNFTDVKYYLDYQQTCGYRKVFDEGGWMVLRRDGANQKSVVVYNNAAFVDQSVPTVMTEGESCAVAITMKNIGIGRWSSKDSYVLAIAGANWGIARADLMSVVNMNSLVTFKFTVRAPTVPGKYSFHCRMVREGLTFFGEATPEVFVSVVK